MTTDSSPEPTLNENQQRSSWWVCTLWIEAPQKPAEFVYGIAAPCRRRGQGARSKVLIASELWSLVQHEVLLAEDQFQSAIVSASQSAINFDASILGDARRIAIADTRSYIGERLGHSAASITSFATCATPPSLANDVGNWTTVLKALEAELGIGFTTDEADRIGCFEVATLQSWLEADTPLVIEAIRPDSQNPSTAGVRRLHICRTADFAQVRHHAHLVCFSDERRLIDRLVVLEQGQQRSPPIEAPHSVDRFEVSVFSEAGELLYRDGAHFINAFQFTTSVQGRKVQLNDELSRRANAQKKKEERSHGQVTSVTHERFGSTCARVNESAEQHRLRMSELLQRCFPSASRDKWFRRTLDGEQGVIAHFDKLLDGGAVSAAVLVDPFFGADALVRLVLRLSSTDVSVTVVTSWTSTDPDTGQRPAGPVSAVTQLEALLRNTNHIVNPNLRVINLVDGTAQAFHDRYLLLYPREGTPQVYLLSNSVNAMAANWPFCMSLLADDVRQQAQAYIEGLSRGVDVAGDTNLTITFKWPVDA